jgi:hypothetical protein
MPDNENWYFSSERRFWKVLRFLNLLEPDRTVLSVTKVSAWLTLANSLHMPENWGAHILTGLAWWKHEQRRRELKK